MGYTELIIHFFLACNFDIFEINKVPSIVICIDILLDNNPKFEEIAEQIKNKFIRDREDSLVKEYIENLRNFYEIEKYSF